MPEEEQIQDGQVPQDAGGLSSADFETGGVASEAPPQPQPEAASQQQPAEPQPVTIRDLAQSLGYSFGQQAPQDDYTALTQLISRANEATRLSEQLRQQDVYRQLGQQLAPQAPQLQQFLQQQQQPKGPKPYEPPPFDKRWAELVERNPQTGLFVSKPNVPPSVAEAANAWADWQSRFMENPSAMLQPLIEEKATEIARQVIQQEMGQFQQQQTVYRLAQANADWAYQKDASGNYLADPQTGQWALTASGQQYVQMVRTLGEMGVADPVHRDQLARLYISRQAAPQPAAAAQRQEQALSRGRPNRNPLQALATQERAAHPYATEPDKKGLSLRERLNQGFEEEGINTKQLQASEAFYGV